ncbi:hypothetical protein Tco_0079833 [Tanacetum coccineum]
MLDVVGEWRNLWLREVAIGLVEYPIERLEMERRLHGGCFGMGGDGGWSHGGEGYRSGGVVWWQWLLPWMVLLRVRWRFLVCLVAGTGCWVVVLVVCCVVLVFGVLFRVSSLVVFAVLRRVCLGCFRIVVVVGGFFLSFHTFLNYSLSQRYERIRKIPKELGIKSALPAPAPAPAPEQASSKSSRKKRKHMELEPEIKILGLECHRALPENVPFVNNMVIKDPEYGIFFIDEFSDKAFKLD